MMAEADACLFACPVDSDSSTKRIERFIFVIDKFGGKKRTELMDKGFVRIREGFFGGIGL
jgi:hypothetical protein